MSFELALALIFLLSSFTMGFAGFGFALVSVPLLSLMVPVQEAVALQFPFCLLLFAYSAWHYHRHAPWRHMKPLLAGTIVGLSIGTFLLFHLPEVMLKKVLAVFIAVVVLLNLLPASRVWTRRLIRTQWCGIVWGLISGSFLGAYTIGGPPAALYIFSVSSDPYTAKSFLASFFTAQLGLMAIVYASTGVLTLDYLHTSLLFTPVVIFGTVLGFWAFGRTSNRFYRRAVDTMLLATALLLWIRS